jgi:hypothetical protein
MTLRISAQPTPSIRRTLVPATLPVDTTSRPVRPMAVASHPSVPATWEKLLAALVTGRPAVLPGLMPAYGKLDETQRQAAVARGAGRTVAQGFLTGDKAGAELEEPVNFIVRGSKEAITQALTSQGWVPANPRTVGSFIKVGLSVLFHWGREPEGPVSEQYLNGAPETMAFNKNSDFNLARDHMRVYYQGKDAKTGEDTWAIAATRDVALEITPPQRTGFHFSTPGFGHQVDRSVDAERDMIMRDMLASGRVQDWAAVTGQRPAGLEGTPQANGKLNIRGYETDGRVYTVSLNN